MSDLIQSKKRKKENLTPSITKKPFQKPINENKLIQSTKEDILKTLREIQKKNKEILTKQLKNQETSRLKELIPENIYNLIIGQDKKIN
ncbi:hypothetical protein M0811_03538 [Anaeramoeba ignava]|uniref:Uncharacterized protein n=1 Tax=Anaeramoeba ignava TaxID=1746090 RepID=A0A9Q0L5L6_ANAIG|nr:hypothetical protein M0811_03538 [Anaeramoeba ignava]